MNIFEVVGPVMVGPSSSHTAGAVKIGYISGRLLGEPLVRAEINLHGSFLATGDGHGTEKSAGGRTFRYADRRYPHPTGTGDR